MNSFILHFKPWLIALACIGVIEVAYYATARPPRATRNSFLDFQFTQEESFQRLVAYEKIVAAEKADPDIIQVGDSSGLHGVQPPVVMADIPGFNYLNLSVATNLGYSGYYNMAKLQLQRSPHARYLVLYTSPLGGVPRKMLWDEDQKLMAPLIHNEFLSPLHRLVQLPTLAARRDILDRVYYVNYRLKQRDAPLATNRGYLAFDSVYRESNGWTRETDVEGDVPTNIYKAILPDIDINKPVDEKTVRQALSTLPKVTDEKFFSWRAFAQTSYFDHVYDAFADLARAHNVKLILIFNPLPQSVRRAEFSDLMDWAAIEAGLNRLRQRHPEVVVTDFEYWPDEKFSVFSHVSTLSSHESSKRVGLILKSLVGETRSGARDKQAGFSVRESVSIDFERHFAGYGWTDKAGTTDKFPMKYVGPRNKAWLYTAIKPGTDYVLKAEFSCDAPIRPELMKLRVNENSAQRLVLNRNEGKIQAEWKLPKAAVDKYAGWITLEFDLRNAVDEGSAAMRQVSFSSVTLRQGQ